MSDLWNLLPPGVVKWAKAILAAVAAVLNILVTTVPVLESGKWEVWVVSALAVIGVAVAPNYNARTVARDLHAQDRCALPDVPHAPTLPSGLATPAETRTRIYELERQLKDPDEPA